MKTSIHTLCLLGAAGFGLAGLSAQAQVVSAAAATPTAPPSAAVATPEADAKDFTVRVGGFFLSSIKTTLSLTDAAGNGGQEVDFSKDLGGENSLNLFRFDAEWRFASKHKVQFAYFDIDRSTSRTINKEINWGDQVFPINTTVTAGFRTAISKLNYAYSFYRNAAQTQEINGLIGFHISRLEASLGTNSGKAEGVSVTAPLPVFGLEWNARLTDKLSSQVAYTYFGLSVDDKYSGNLSDFQAVLEYQVHRNWSVGGGYNRYTMRASAESDRLKLTMRHNYNGLLLFVSARF